MEETSDPARVRLNIGLWLAVLLAGAAVIVLAAMMWGTHRDDGGSVLARIGRTIVDKQDAGGASVGKDVGSGVVSALPAAPSSDQERIADVLESGTKFVNTFLNVDYKTMDSTFAAVQSMQTPQARAKFVKSEKATRTLLQRVKAVETAKVVWGGYSSGDADSATLLFATEGTKSTVMSKGKAIASYARIVLDLQKSGDRWLISNITFLGNQ